MKPDKLFAKRINDRFAKKQNEMRRDPGEMGDSNNNLYVSGFDSYVYVTIGDKVLPVFNNRVAPQIGVKVWVGYAPEEPTLYQVLSTRSETPAGVETGFVGYAPSRRYEWHAPGGGQDMLNVHLRAFSPLKLGVSNTENSSTLYVDLYRGFVYTGTGYLAIQRQDLDLYAHIPTAADKAALVLITIDDAGAVIQTKGAEVDIDALVLADLPAIPAGTVFVCGAVRVYTGQVAVQEGRTNTDFWDGRFPGYSMAGAWVWGTGTGTLADQTDLQAALDLKASITYVDGLVTGLWDDRGNFDASVNAYPSSGGSGTAGAILKGDIWTVSVAGTLPTGQPVEVGDTVRALSDTPGNTQANWAIAQQNIGYVAENAANKVTSISGSSTDVQYPSAKLLFDQLALKQAALTFPIAASLGGTGVSNGALATLTLPNFPITIAGGVTGGTYTLPSTAGGGTVALLNTAQTFTVNQRIDALVGINAAPLSYSQLTMKVATAGNYAMILTSSANKYIMLVDSAGGMQFGNTTLIGFNTATASTGPSPSIDGKTFQIQNSNVFSAGEYAVAVMSSAYATYTTGNGGMFRVTGRYRVASGSGIWNTFALTPYIDQAGATGDIIGLYYYPTITNLSGSHYSIKTESGIGYFRNESSTNNAILESMRVEAATILGMTGTAAGFGPSLAFRALTATAFTQQRQALISSEWIDATNASRKAKMSLSAYDTAARLGIEIEASGTVAMLSFYGGTTVIRGAALTTQLTTITHTAPGTPDYAIQDLINIAPYGFATQDEGNTVLSTVRNLQLRVAELEARLGSATGVNLFA